MGLGVGLKGSEGGSKGGPGGRVLVVLSERGRRLLGKKSKQSCLRSGCPSVQAPQADASSAGFQALWKCDPTPQAWQVPGAEGEVD